MNRSEREIAIFAAVTIGAIVLVGVGAIVWAYVIEPPPALQADRATATAMPTTTPIPTRETAPTKTPEPTRTTRPTAPPTPTEAPAPTVTPTPKLVIMFFCGFDRCRDSGEYGQLISLSDINVWDNPDPDRGEVKWRASHLERVIILQEKRIGDGPGGLWYELAEGGWTNDLWLTDAPCTQDNLAEYSFTDCQGGEY